jgi:hypothetical protein
LKDRPFPSGAEGFCTCILNLKSSFRSIGLGGAEFLIFAPG